MEVHPTSPKRSASPPAKGVGKIDDDDEDEDECIVEARFNHISTALWYGSADIVPV